MYPASLSNSLINNKAKIEAAHSSLAQLEPTMEALTALVVKDYSPTYSNVPQNLQDNASKAAQAVKDAVGNLERAIQELQGIYDGYIIPNAG